MNIQIMVVIVLLIAGGGYLFKDQIDQRVAAETAATAERTRADLAEVKVKQLETDLENERERLAELQTDLQAARNVEAKATSVLQDRERLKRLTGLKPGRLEIKARKATTMVWKTIEEESAE